MRYCWASSHREFHQRTLQSDKVIVTFGQRLLLILLESSCFLFHLWHFLFSISYQTKSVFLLFSRQSVFYPCPYIGFFPHVPRKWLLFYYSSDNRCLFILPILQLPFISFQAMVILHFLPHNGCLLISSKTTAVFYFLPGNRCFYISPQASAVSYLSLDKVCFCLLFRQRLCLISPRTSMFFISPQAKWHKQLLCFLPLPFPTVCRALLSIALLMLFFKKSTQVQI